ncbi:MAG TPA: class II aldolase/adducin family protein [Novosphingobium sp.]|nr:class II aldolase/adducin family protein [Novosphingobium sp.]
MPHGLSKETIAFVRETEADARKAFRWLRETQTTSPSATVGFAVRVPGEDKIVTLAYAGLWAEDPDAPITEVIDFDGNTYWGGKPSGESRYLKIFRKYEDFQAISHVHAPNLGAYSQAHSELPLLYVPNRRFRTTTHLPVYINRRQSEADFILEAIAADKQTPGIVEANGGATVWSFKGLRHLVQNIILLEEGARFQVLAAALGGSRPFGPGVLEQQWKIGGLVPADAHVTDDGQILLANPAPQAAE